MTAAADTLQADQTTTDAAPGLGRSYWLAFSWGAWPALIPLFTFLLSPARHALFEYEFASADTRIVPGSVRLAATLILLLGMGPALLSALQARMDWRRMLPFLALSAPLLLIIPLSLFQKAELTHVPLVGLVLYAFGVIAMFSAYIGDDMAKLRAAFTGYVALHVLAILMMFVMDPNFIYGRMIGRIGPNYWGSVALYTALVGLALRPAWLRVAAVALGTLVIVMCQNRTSLIGLSAGGGTVAVLAFIAGDSRTRIRLAFGVMAALLVLVLAAPFLAEKVFLVDNARRGIGSGGTGRFDAWVEAYQIFETHPLLGVGYRQHERLIASASSAHNAYLATLADMGVFGILSYLLFLLASLSKAILSAVRTARWEIMCLAGIIAAYAAQGFFEQRAINLANSSSLVVIMAIAIAINLKTRRLR